jgi:glycosyltransferase involved in cell wall biosynthesis
MSRFPAVTETFILRELVELERLGVPVILVPLLEHRVATLHPQARPWVDRALYSPFLSPAIVWANLKALLRGPVRYLGTLLSLLWEASGSWNAFVGVIGIFPKSVWNGARIRALGVRHIHAHYATHPAAAAYIMTRVHTSSEQDLSYSVTVHAHDIFLTHAGLRRKLAAARFVRSISEFNVRYLLDHLGGGQERLKREQFRVIHCGIQPRQYTHEPLPGVAGRDRAARLLSVAAHRPYKGLTHLIEAVRLLRHEGRNVACDVIGDGVLRPQLEAQIRDAALGEHFRLLGTRSEDEVAEALRSCDVFVLPSVVAEDGQMEGIPVALMEPLAAGVPVVATRISGIPELVRDGETGTLVPPGDPVAIASAVARVLDDPEAARCMSEAGRRLVEAEFDIQDCVRRLVAEMAQAVD